MPLTSLAAQLKKLETPQTSLLRHRKYKPSLLFDPKEAANYDRDTFYELGLSGLEELKKLNPHFSAFENTLFDVSSKSFERSVETPDSNRKLDHHIRTFLTLLSPYFLLKPSHKALEWLINRYHIEDFNVDDVLFLCLPYHDTAMFGRLLTVLRIDENDSRWGWLKPCQKKGVPLSKQALLNRAATDMAFLKFVANMPAQAIKVHGDKASSLGTLYAFYCTTLIGGLEHANPVTELHVSHLLPSLMSALASSIVDYTASAYMIVARLATKTGLGNKLLQGLYNKIAKVEHPKLRAETTLILVLLAQNDKNRSKVPDRCVRRLADTEWFVPNLAKLCDSGVYVAPLVTALLSSALDICVQPRDGRPKGADADNDAQEIKALVNRILEDLRFDESQDAEQIFGCILEAYDINCGRDKQNWFVRALQSLENKYPTAYDNVISAALNGRGTRTAVAVKRLLGENTSRNQLFQKLIHPNPDVRIEAIEHIGQHFKPSRLAWLRETLEERLSDDNQRVVGAMLKLNDSLLASIAEKSLVSRLVSMLVRWHTGGFAQVGEETSALAVGLLLRHMKKQHRPSVMLVLLPIILDSSLGNIHKVVLKSVDNWPFLKHIRDNYQEGVDLANSVWQIIEEMPEMVPTCREIVGALEEMGGVHNVYRFVAMLLTTAGIPKDPDPSVVNSAISYIIEYMQSPGLMGDENSVPLNEMMLEPCVLSSLCQDILPVQGVLYSLVTLARRTTPPPPAPPDQTQQAPPTAPVWLSFHEKYNSLLLASFRVIIKGLSSADQDLHRAFVHVSEAFFKNYFTSEEALIHFLINSVLFEASLGSDCLHLAYRKLKRNGALSSKLLERDSTTVPGLLLLLNCPDFEIRNEAVGLLKCLLKTDATPFYKPFAGRLYEHRDEILVDPDQVAVVVYMCLSPSKEVQSLLPAGLHQVMRSTLDQLMAIVLGARTPLHIKARLLQILENVNSEELCLELFPLVGDMIGRSSSLSNLQSAMAANILARLNENTVSCFAQPQFWDFANRVVKDQSTRVKSADGKYTVPAVLFMNQISRRLFDNLPAPIGDSQERLLAMVMAGCADCERAEVATALAALFKRISLDGSLVVALFTPMLHVATHQPAKPTIRKRSSTTPSLELLETSEWKRGVCLLELIQGKKKLTNVQLLLPRLFEILNKCLMFEQQAPVEYTKQLVLSAVLHCCQYLGAGDGELLQVDLIVQCVRASHNPQTHHHALLALTHMAHLLPEQVLHNIMAIFTFIGSSVLRQDDAYSFQIISKIVDTIIPILVQRGYGDGDGEDATVSRVVGVLRVFVGAMMDVPEHRRIALFNRLLATLNNGQYLWLFLCLVFDSHVRPTPNAHPEEKNKGMNGVEQHGTAMPRRLEVSLQLCCEFQPQVVLKTCHKLFEHLVFMPHDKDETINKERYRATNAIFDIANCTGKQLRHYKYTVLMFLSSVVSSPHFVQQIAALSESEMGDLETVFGALIEQCLVYVKSVTRKSEESSNAQTAKYWKAMLNQSYDVLDKTNALLPADLFLNVIGSLVTESDDPVLRRKAMELVGWKLQQPTPLPEGPLLALARPISAVLATIEPAAKSPSQQSQLTQQTALFALKLIIRHLAASNHQHFQKILGVVSDILCWRESANWSVLGCVILCLGELVSTLKAHSIQYMPQFMPALVDIMSKNEHIGNEVFAASVVTTIQKIVEVLARFMSPYLSRLLYEVCVMSARFGAQTATTTVAAAATTTASANAATATGTTPAQPPILHKLKAIRSKISCEVESRVLVPAISDCYRRLIDSGEYHAVGPLMSVLSESFRSSSDLGPPLVALFLAALDFRSSRRTAPPPPPDVDCVETPVLSALTRVVLKLSESAFRPLYYKLYDWALRDNERAITFYRLSSEIAESLKGLFVLFAGHFVSNAALLLDKNNTAKWEEGDGGWFDTVDKSCQLVDSILSTLITVFTYDSHQFVNKERFDTLSQPLVDQLDNRLGGDEVSSARNQKLVSRCLASMAVCVADDSLWKQLNYQILLKTRSNIPQVRLAGLRTVLLLAEKLGENFLALLPETVPFLAELLEDDDEEIERQCQQVVNRLEILLGEPIQKYF